MPPALSAINEAHLAVLRPAAHLLAEIFTLEMLREVRESAADDAGTFHRLKVYESLVAKFRHMADTRASSPIPVMKPLPSAQAAAARAL